MSSRPPMLLGLAIGCACWLTTPSASGTQTATLHAAFQPDRLGAPTNLSATADFGSTMPGALSPVSTVTTYGPAGMSLDVRGAGICRSSVARLEAIGPRVCPADSRLGFGRAVGAVELAAAPVPEPLTLEFFLAPRQHGRMAMLVYASGSTPALEQLALSATEVRAPSPYGLGIRMNVPLVSSLPGAAPGWVQHVQVSLGSAHAAYYRTIDGRRRLLHVRGVTVPKTCPRGGFPMEAQIAFADGDSTIAKTTIPCPVA